MVYSVESFNCIRCRDSNIIVGQEFFGSGYINMIFDNSGSSRDLVVTCNEG